MEEKICGVCGTNFKRNTKKHHNLCKVCARKETCKNYYINNIENIKAKNKELEKLLEIKEKNRQKYLKYKHKYAEKSKKYRQEHLEKYREYRNKWKINNPEKDKESKKKYKLKNKEKIRESERKRRHANPEKVAIKTHRRRARKMNNGGTFADKEWLKVKEIYNYTCLRGFDSESNVKLTIDHVIPLVLGGLNSIENIQPLCLSCNSSKGTKSTDYRCPF